MRANPRQANPNIIQVNLSDVQAHRSDIQANWSAIQLSKLFQLPVFGINVTAYFTTTNKQGLKLLHMYIDSLPNQKTNYKLLTLKKGNLSNKIDSHGADAISTPPVVGFNTFNPYINNIYGAASCKRPITANFQ